jgi:serine/threonine protein kinase
MTGFWTSEDIEAILIQLNQRGLPFAKYEFCTEKGRSVMLGKGASANVYEAKLRKKDRRRYAVKVIGFCGRHADSGSFWQMVQVQKGLADFQTDVVKIYEAAEYRVWIRGEHTIEKTEKVEPWNPPVPEGNYLHLQFVVMEKVSAVLQKRMPGKPRLVPERLATANEEEILKLACEIGTALARAHEKQVIHRDIKLENIFYTQKGGHYKLGDFGIARVTEHGMASTVAFTNGYGAPEVVGTLEDSYDCTADIYSFGMVLYVLLNGMRFPESEHYRPNIHQYDSGYEAPPPVGGGEEFGRIVQKMIRFSPDDRYQSMDEVLNELEKLRYDGRSKYQREHRKTSLALGTVFALSGAVLGKLSFFLNQQIAFSVWMCIFCVLCIGKGLLAVFQKPQERISLALLVVGIGVLISDGFAWWKLLLLLYLTFAGEVMTGLFGCGVVLLGICSLPVWQAPAGDPEPQSLRWAAVLCLSMGAVFLFWYYILGERDGKLGDMCLKKNRYWKLVTCAYASVAIAAIGREYPGESSFDLLLVGLVGAAICLGWMVRERVVMKIGKY